MILERINEPSDLKDLSLRELDDLSKEIREVLLQKLSNTGGHIGPNLGMVEVTIAMHKVFNSPIDKIVFDVSHQSYIHKILTGRKKYFLNSENYNMISGYTNPNESKHDFFTIGHTSTSISLACGLAKARDLKETNENIIAVIGDGSLSGGEAYEGLNNIAEMGTNMIIIVNDNDMSIAENYGGLYKNLHLLRETKGNSENNFFKSLGLDYIYIDDGHNLEELINVFSSIKDTKSPVVVHIRTIKGKGYEVAEKDKETWHYNGPFDRKTGEIKQNYMETYSSLTGKYLLEKMKEDKTVAAITAGTPIVINFNEKLRKEAGKQFIDVGIAEEHAIALASGMAANKAKPVFAVFSTFLQRCYDQLSQDLCINNNPALILVFGGGLTTFSDVTHLGYFDIPLISNIPNLVYLAPTSKEEYMAMLEWGIEQNSHPVAIKVPTLGIIETNEIVESNYENLNKYLIKEKGKNVAIIGLGDFYELGKDVKELLKEKTGINATLINPRYITGLDDKVLNLLKEDHEIIITLENGILDGGFGAKISRYYGTTNIKVLNFGGKKEFTDRIAPEIIYKNNWLTKEQIVSKIISEI